jgi:glycosidase
VEPWLPFGDLLACNVEDQRHDPASMLTLTRDLIALRAGRSEFGGPYRSLDSPPGTWVWARGQDLKVVVNMTDTEAVFGDVDGTVLIGSDRRLDGQSTRGGLRLPGWRAAVVERG